MRLVIGFLATFCVVALVLYLYIKPRPFCRESFSTNSTLTPADYKKSFEWEDVIPHLDRAACLSPKDGVRLLLQNVSLLRASVAIQLQARCNEQSIETICTAGLGQPTLEAAITSKIDENIAARTSSFGTMTSVDYVIPHQPFPFTAITALRSHNSPYAALAFEMPDRSPYSRSRIVNKYGRPTDEKVDAESYQLLSYKSDSTEYASNMQFQINPYTDATRRVTVSVQKHRRR